MEDKTKKHQEIYKDLGITEKDYPRYTNADDYAKNLKRCDILEYGNICYSNNSDSTTFLKKK
ncbi:MAG: hypothetical protein PF447_10210 [Spirochaetaceae bacterium]|jgi:DNA-directed RNA polymerase subunit H (RpoH/RPB5)|nr:hypothetical protein [Spirochaetaceae bacterium]